MRFAMFGSSVPLRWVFEPGVFIGVNLLTVAYRGVSGGNSARGLRTGHHVRIAVSMNSAWAKAGRYCAERATLYRGGAW